MDSKRRKTSRFATLALTGSLVSGLALSTAGLAQAQDNDFQGTPASNGVYPENATATFPLVFCWYKGRVLFYIRIDTSDQPTAEQQGLNYVPQLANVLTSQPAAYDDIYTFTNFQQFNVVPSAPHPVGPKNVDRTYQPLWQVSQVAWNSGKQPRTLRSEEEILAAKSEGEVTVTKTNVVINCPIIFTPEGGKLPNVKITFGGRDKDREREQK
ncbi:MAG: hypothetical protein M3Y72_10855 [Acidobacteriota bacterium]|nr:hypothetical protein [Acidobacteriota bacterium]